MGNCALDSSHEDEVQQPNLVNTVTQRLLASQQASSSGKLIILVSIVICGWETWSLGLKEEHKLGLLEQDAEENILT